MRAGGAGFPRVEPLPPRLAAAYHERGRRHSIAARLREGDRMKRLALMIGLVVAASAAPSDAIDPGTAMGDLIVEGQATPLTHAYAFERDNAEGMMDGAELRILLTDVAVPDAAKELARLVPSFGPLGMQASEGKLKGVLIKLDPAKPKDAAYITVLIQGPPGQSFMTITRSPAPFTSFAAANNRVSGGGEIGPFKGTFDAPLVKMAPVKDHLKGKAAAESAPAKVFLATEQAMRAGDLTAAQKGMTAAKWQAVNTFVQQVGAAEFAKQASQFFPDTATRTAQIKDAVLRADSAFLVVDEGNGKLGVPLVLEGGQWKLDE